MENDFNILFSLEHDKVKALENKIDECIKSNAENYEVDTKNEIVLSDRSLLIGYALFRYIIDKNNMQLPNTEDDFTKFAELFFRCLNEIIGRKMYSYMEDIFKIMFVFYNYGSDLSFNKFVSTIKRENEVFDFFDVMLAYSDVLPFLKSPPQDIYANLDHFVNESQGDGAVGFLYTAIRKYSQVNIDRGWAFVNFLKESNHHNFLLDLLLGLSVTDYNRTLIYIGDLLTNDLYITVANETLGKIRYKNHEDFINAIESIYKTLEKVKTEEVKNSVASSLIAILENVEIIDKNIVERIETTITDLYKSKNPEVQYLIIVSLFRLRVQNKYVNSLKKKVVLLFVDTKTEYMGTIGYISHVLNDINDISINFQFIKGWSENHPFEDISSFYRTILDKYEDHTNLFWEHLLMFLCSPKACYRFCGNAILDNMFEQYNIQQSKEEVLKLSEKYALRIIKSVFTGYLHISQRIVLLIPLVDHGSDNVKIQLLQWLVWLTHDYGSLIRETILSFEDESSKNIKVFANEYENYFLKIKETWDKKDDLKEIQAHWTHNSLKEKFDNIYMKHESEEIRKQVDEKSIMTQLVTKVEIGRGYSWKFRPQGKPMPMHKIEKRIEIPLTYFVSPERYDLDRHRMIHEDWGD